jgi:hypothetical protein
MEEREKRNNLRTLFGVENMTACARARWKIENEHNNGEKKSRV